MNLNKHYGIRPRVAHFHRSCILFSFFFFRRNNTSLQEDLLELKAEEEGKKKKKELGFTIGIDINSRTNNDCSAQWRRFA